MSTSLWILVAVAYVAWRVLRARGLNPRAGKESPLPKMRNERSGDEGEARVQAELVDILTWLCGRNFYLHCGPLLLNHAPGTEFPTAEIDHLAITPFGIFIFETKNWTGLITPGPSAEVLIRIGADGEPQARKSPLSQNRSKLAFLRGILQPVWSIEDATARQHFTPRRPAPVATGQTCKACCDHGSDSRRRRGMGRNTTNRQQ